MRRSQVMVPGLLPYRILFVILVLVALVAVVLGALSDHEDLRTMDMVVAVVVLCIAFLVRFAGPRVRDGIVLDAVLVVMILIASYGALVVPDGEGQVLIGLGMLLFTAFAAAFRPTIVFGLLLGVAVVSYTAAAIVNPQTRVAVTILAVDALIIGTSVMIHGLIQRQHRAATIDPLTGAFNRRGLESLAPALAGSAGRGGQDLTVGVIDLDRFKVFNDRFGHAAGDRLLVDVVRAWRRALRRSDVVVRLGGDEFALVLVGVAPDAAEQMAERVPRPEGASWTAGFSRWDPDEDIYDALHRADEVMYARKDHEPGARLSG